MKTINWILVFSGGIGGDWLRHIDLAVLLRWLKKQGARYNKNYFIYQGVLKENTTEEEQRKLLTFWNVTDMGGLSKASDLTSEEEKLVEDKFVGWIVTPHIEKDADVALKKYLKEQK